jgi:hypothetical protein
MDSLSAAGYIATSVLPNAQKLKPETTQTPEPLDIPDGKGAPEVNPNDEYMKGGQFV